MDSEVLSGVGLALRGALSTDNDADAVKLIRENLPTLRKLLDNIPRQYWRDNDTPISYGIDIPHDEATAQMITAEAALTRAIWLIIRVEELNTPGGAWMYSQVSSSLIEASKRYRYAAELLS